MQKLVTLSTVLALSLLSTRLSNASEPIRNERVIFDSNSTGTFSIQSIALDGSDRQILFDSPANDMYPDISPDGQTLVFAKVVGDKSSSDKSIWLANIDGTNPRLLADSGTYPSFSADGQRVFFERGRNKVMVVNVSDSKVSEFFPRDIKAFARREIAVPSVSPDERYIAVTIDYPHKWKTWVYDFTTEEFFMLGHGCQGNWSANSNSLFWVERGNFNSITALSSYDVKERKNTIFHDHGEPYGQEYFPYVTRDRKLLLWAASPKDEHSHYSANYQLFYRKFNDPTRYRITNDSHTNRWPKLYRQSKAKYKHPTSN